MILVDSSVWIDYLRGNATAPVEKLESLLGIAPLAVGDLILAEVLQGCGSEKEFDSVRTLLFGLVVVDLCGAELAVQSARHFRTLRQHGITVRKTIDCIIATRCVVDDLELLHDDRDFDAYEKHLGLRCVAC